MAQEPTYQHDCDACRFLGCGSPPILQERRGRPTTFDFYVCESSRQRSFIARYGNRPEEYMSGTLFRTVELTALDKVALFGGLELLPEENDALLRCLARMLHNQIGRKGYDALYAGPECLFGCGNVVFENP